jgi:hypothetical protein
MAVIVTAAATFMIVVPLLAQPAVADQSEAAPTVVPQQPPTDSVTLAPQQPPISDSVIPDGLQDFADRMALDQRLHRVELQIQTLLNTAPKVVPEQPPIADHAQDFADRIALDQRLQRLELQIQTLLDIQLQILSNSGKRGVQTRTEISPKSWVVPKQTTAKSGYHRRHEIDGTAFARGTVDANPAAHEGITKAFGCPGSVPCVERGTAPVTAPKAGPEYDEAGAEIK